MKHTYIHKIIGIPVFKKTVCFENGLGAGSLYIKSLYSKYYIFNILVYEKYLAD